jgi:hypothetical protein
VSAGYLIATTVSSSCVRDSSYDGTLVPCRPLAPIRMWPDVSALAAANAADKPLLEIGQPNIIGPMIATDRDVVAAMIISAIDLRSPRTPDERISASVIFCGRADMRPSFDGTGRCNAVLRYRPILGSTSSGHPVWRLPCSLAFFFPLLRPA